MRLVATTCKLKPVLLGFLWLSLVFFILFISVPYRRFRMAFTDQTIRAGPGGIEVRIPKTSFKTLFFGIRIVTYHMTWDEIDSYYSFLGTVNFIPMEKLVRIDLKNGERLEIPSFLFRGSAQTVVDAITASVA